MNGRLLSIKIVLKNKHTWIQAFFKRVKKQVVCCLILPETIFSWSQKESASMGYSRIHCYVFQDSFLDAAVHIVALLIHFYFILIFS